MVKNMMEFRETMKKVVIFTVKGCYRSICNHPFSACMLCFLVFLYRSFPFLFSLLVSTSPVIVCTAILLGTLLSFGKPNIPEIEREERTTHEIVSLKTGFSENSIVFDRNESVSVERYGDKGKNVVGALIRESSSVENEISGAGSDGGFGHVLEKMSKEIEFDGGDREERRREFVDFELESKSEMFGERIGDIPIVENHYSLIPEVDDEHTDLENDRSPTCSVDSKVVNVDCLDSPPCTPWRHVNQEDEDENEDDEALDSGSDRAESSSPDASLADILPVLDELHPLLDEDSSHGPHPVNLAHDGSDASSEQSDGSDESSNESDNDTETQVSEIADNDNEDGEGEDEEETHQEEEDQTKSAIRWTEEDERNLMDLGSSELERNQRLENLIARRRARKTMSVVPETNLIDLESTDFTFSVPPILSTRNNPFDVSQNSYEDMGLPPIPGSAPSVLLHRRNPFDIPYDSSEEKPDLMEDSFQQEFTPSQSKEHFFRRHESFNSWRTPFGISRSEKQDMSRFRPFFVEERLGSEGTSFSPFDRQLSEISDSKASSVPETGSISSSENTEEWNVNGEETSEIEDRITNVEDDITRELDLITRAELASELAGHGSESSEEDNSIELSQVETIPMKDDATERKLEDTGYHQEAESSLVVEQGLATQSKTSLTEGYSNVEAHEQRYKSSSSSSSLSEESERIYVENEVEAFPSFIDETYHLEDRSVSAQPSLQDSHLSITAPLRDDAFRDPVYDLSPSSVRKPLSRSSNASEIDLDSVGVKKSVSFSDRVTMIRSREMESDTIVDKQMSAGSSDIVRVDESQMASSIDVQITNLGTIRNVTERITEGDMHTTEHNDINYDLSEDGQISAIPLTSGDAETEIISGHMEIAERDDLRYELSESHKNSASATSSVVPETVLDNVEQSFSGGSLSLMHEDITFPHSTSVGTDTDVIQSLSLPLNELNLAGSVELASADTHGVQSIEDYTTQEESMLSEETLLQSSFDRPDHEDKTLTPLSQFPSAESFGSLPVEEMAPSQNSFSVSSPEDHKEAQKSEISAVESVQEASTTDSWSNYDIPQIDNKLSLDIEVPTSPKSTAVPAEVFGFQSVEELDEIKEIDEHLLEELDAVGDFRVKEFRGFNDPVEDAEELGSTIKEFNQYDEDTEHVSVLERSVMDPIDLLQYDGLTLDDSGHLESSEDKLYLKEEQTDFEAKSLAEISDIEENESVMAEIEARFAKTIEAMIIKTESTSAKTGVLQLDPPPSFVDLALEEYSTAGSESITTGKTLGEANIHVETQEFQDLDLNQPPVENVEQVLVSGSVHSVDGAKHIEGTFPELLLLKTKSLDDSDSALKPESRTSSSEGLGFSEVLTAKDVRADLNLPKESKSGAEESDVVKHVQHSLEESDIVEAITPESDDVLVSERKSLDDSLSDPKQEPDSSPRESLEILKSGAKESDVMKHLQHSLEESEIVEAKTPKSHDVLISEGKSLDDSFSDPKQESQSSPRESLEILEDVRADLGSPRGSKYGAEESDMMKTRQQSLEESDIVESKTPGSDDVLILERKLLDDSLSDPKQESDSSPGESLEILEDVLDDLDSPRELKSGVKESDVMKHLQHSLEESEIVEAKTPKRDDVLISERKSLDDSFSDPKQESQSSPRESSTILEDVRADLDSPRGSKYGAEESDMIKTRQHSLEESDIVEAKTPESDNVLISEKKILDDSFSDPKQESHSSPREALKISEDVRVDLDSTRELKSRAEESDVLNTLQNSLVEPDNVEAKTPERDDVILSKRKSLDDTFSAPRQESQSSPSEALKTSENVPASIYSPGEAMPGAEDSDVKITQRNSLEEQELSESHDVLISERHSLNDSDSTLKKESQSSPSEASKLPPENDESAEHVRADIDSPSEENPGIEESDGGKNIKETNKKSSSSSSSSSSDSSSSDSDRE